MSKPNFWYKVTIVISILLFTQVIGPFTKEGLWLGHDSQLHTIYLKKFDTAIRDGQFPVRWIDWFKIGHNQPLFNFYQPGVYYLYMIPRTLGLGYVESLNVEVISLWLLSALLMFLFARRHLGTSGGILAAYLYMLAPYHIVDILVRAAMPEFTALAFVPGIFWGIKGYFDSKKTFYLSLTALFTALTAFSHPPTIIMFSLLILSYLGYLSYLGNLKMAAKMFAAILLGFGLVSFSLLPAFFEQQSIQPIFLRSGYYDFRHHFLCPEQIFSTFWGNGTSAEGCIDGMSFQFGLVHWAGIALALILVFWGFLRLRNREKTKNESLSVKFIDLNALNSSYLCLMAIFLSILIIATYLMFFISAPVWQTLPYIPYIQYSWRFLAVVVFTSSFLTASILPLIKTDNLRLIVFALFMASATFAYGNYLKPIAYGTPSEIQFGEEILHPSLNLKNFDPEPGYMPKWTHILPAEDDRPKEEFKFLSGNGTLKDYKLSATRKSYEFDSNVPQEARFYVHFYPGWKVYINDKEVKPNYDNIYGFMDVKIPPGNNKVLLKFEDIPIRTVSNWMSVGFVIIVLLVAFYPRFSNKSNDL